MTELEPCWGCGRTDKIRIYTKDHGLFRCRIVCTRYGCMTFMGADHWVIATNKEKAVRKWNKKSKRIWSRRWRLEECLD